MAQSAKADVESLVTEERHRGRCLDVFLLTSVLFLFVAVTGLAVVGGVVVMRLQPSPEPQLQVGSGPEEPEGTPSPAFKMQNFAYLEPNSSALGNMTMKWAAVKYGEGTSLGSNFVFNPSHHSLMPKKAGPYFMYVTLNFTCTYQCSAGKLSIKVGDVLTCDVELTAERRSVSQKCWTVAQLEERGLLAQMIVPKEELHNWKLELPGSQFGMFLVD